MGLISLTWVFCHNLVKSHLVVIEILSFSCSVLLILQCQIAKKKSKWLNAFIVTQKDIFPLKDFSSFILYYF